MNAALKNAARAITPPIVWQALHSLLRAPRLQQPPPVPEIPARQYGASGDYASYAEALEACGGSYHNNLVQEKTRSLTAAIKVGPEISQLNIRLLAALQYAAARLHGPLDVLDFGGAMGAHYFYLRSFFEQIGKWTVVEIEETVAMGNEHFADGKLSFETQISDMAPIILTSGAIQYTDDPYGSLARLLERGARFVILDKVPTLDRDRRTVQYIHPSVFGAEVSFPSYFFDEAKFRSRFAPYRIVMEWELPGYAAHLDGQYLEINRGFLLEHPAPIHR